MSVDHDHTHQWERLGVHRDAFDVRVVYQCEGCSAWSERPLKRSAIVSFRRGELPDDD